MVCQCYEDNQGRQRVGFVSLAVMRQFGHTCNDAELCEAASIATMHLTFARIMRGMAAQIVKGAPDDEQFEKMLGELVEKVRAADTESEAMIAAMGKTRQ